MMFADNHTTEVKHQSLDSNALTVAPAPFQLFLTPLGANQQRLWQLAKMCHNNAYTRQMCWKLTNDCQLSTVEQAFRLVLSQYPLLTCAVVESQGQPHFRLRFAPVSIEFERRDLSSLNEPQLQGFVANQLKQPFDLNDKPLIRPLWLNGAGGHNMLVIEVHQVLFDDNCYALFNHALWYAYGQLRRGRTPKITQQFSYRDLNAWERQMLRSPEGLAHQQYWRGQLNGASALLKLPNNAQQIEGKTTGCASYSMNLGAELTQLLKQFKNRRGVKTTVVLMATLKALMYKYTGQDDIVIGAPIKGPSLRMNEDFGYYTNVLPIRSRMSEGLTFTVLLDQLATTIDQGSEHGDHPLLGLASEPNTDSFAPFTQRIQVSYGYHIEKPLTMMLAQLGVSEVKIDQDFIGDLAFHAFKEEGDYRLCIHYHRHLFEQQTVITMMRHYLNLLVNLIATPTAPLCTVECLSGDDKRQILYQFNQSQQSIEPVQTLQGLFEQQAQLKPYEQALICAGKGVSFEQLNQNANQMAHELIFHGIEARTRVAICLPPSLDMVVAILGVVKTGAAFVLIDPDAGEDFKTYVLTDTKARAVISLSHLPVTMPKHRCRAILLDQCRAKLALSQRDDPVLAKPVKATDLCQLSYNHDDDHPVGIMVSHQNIVNMGFALQQQFHQLAQSEEGLWGWQQPFSQHSSVKALSQLVLGRCCYLLSDTMVSSPQVLARFMVDNHIRFYQASATELLPLIQALTAVDKARHMCLLLSGETPDWHQWQQLIEFAKVTDSQAFYLYAQEETTLATIRKISGVSPTNIGRSISNSQVYVLDQAAKPVPIGVKGDIYVGGKGLVKGYVNQDRLSAQRFIINPFDPSEQSRLFKTGDTGRFLNDGTLELG